MPLDKAAALHSRTVSCRIESIMEDDEFIYVNTMSRRGLTGSEDSYEVRLRKGEDAGFMDAVDAAEQVDRIAILRAFVLVQLFMPAAVATSPLDITKRRITAAYDPSLSEPVSTVFTSEPL